MAIKKKSFEDEIKKGVLNEIEYNSYSKSIMTRVLESIE